MVVEIKKKKSMNELAATEITLAWKENVGYTK